MGPQLINIHRVYVRIRSGVRYHNVSVDTHVRLGRSVGLLLILLPKCNPTTRKAIPNPQIHKIGKVNKRMLEQKIHIMCRVLTDRGAYRDSLPRPAHDGGRLRLKCSFPRDYVHVFLSSGEENPSVVRAWESGS